MDNTQTLELQIKSTADGAVKSVKLLNSSLTNTKSTVDNVSKSINKMGKAFSMGGLYVGVKKLSTTFLKWMDLAVDRTEQLNLFNVVFKNMEKNGTKTFSTLGRQATQFQNKLNEAFGTNLTETTKYQGLFQSMGENVGIPDTYSALMSTTMTKLTYDLASLYNKQENVVAEALRAGVYAGQTKPLRSYGIDVTQTSMQPILDSLGITDRSVKQMSQAEKEILRYLATLRQAKVAMGDFANTIESPSNQLKVFKQQLAEAKIALSSLFIGTFSKILPYANALLMVVKEVAKAIGTMFGIKLSDYNTGIADSSDAFVDLGDSIDGATESAKELKRQTLGFDQINNINENKDSGGGSGSASGGIDQRLLDAIKGYDNGMDKVRMKATEIRDRIMEWLGFTKEIDPLTGEISWKLDDSNSTMGKIISSLKDVVKYGKDAIVGVFKVLKDDFDNGAFGKVLVGVFEAIADLFKFIASHKEVQKIIAKIIEGFLLFKTIKTVLKPVVTLWNTFTTKIQTGAKFVQTFGKQLKGTNNYIIDSEGNLKEYNKTLDKHKNVVLNADESVNKWQTALNRAKTALVGIGTSVAGLYMVHDAIKDIADEGPNVTNVFEGILGSVSTIGGFATIGSAILPGVGTAIGAVAGVITTLTMALGTWSSENDTFTNSIKNTKASIDEYNSSMQELADSRNKILSSVDVEFGYYESLYKELQSIVDENGKIKSGYEDRAKVITTVLSDALGIEIQIVDGVIQKYGDLETSIYDVINAKKAEATLNAYETEYNEAMKKKKTLQDDYAKSVKDTKKAQKEYSESLKEVADYFGLTTEQVENYYNGTLKINDTHGELRRSLSNLADSYGNKYVQSLKYWTKKLDDAKLAEKDAGKALDDNQVIIDNYNKAIELMAGKHYDAVLKIYNNTVTFNGKTKAENDKKYKEEIEIIDKHLKDLKTRKSEYSEEEYNALVEGYKLQKEALKQSKDDANKILKQKTEEAKEETLKTVNEQLKVFKDHKYKFKETSNGMMQLYVDGIKEGKPISETAMTNLINETIKKIKDKKLSAKEAGEYLLDGVNLGLSNTSKQNTSFTTVVTFATNLLNKFKSVLGIKSPSRETKQMGIYLLEGLGLGLESEKQNTLSKVSNLSSEILEEMNMDLGKYILDFNNQLSSPTINGNINHKTNYDIGSLMAEKISMQLANAINNRPIQVELQAHTDEGVVIDRINQSTKQTGVCPINIPLN